MSVNDQAAMIAVLVKRIATLERAASHVTKAGTIPIIDTGGLYTATDVEAALAELAAQPQAWAPIIQQGYVITKTIHSGWYIKRPDGTYLAHLSATMTSVGNPGNPIAMSLPFTLPTAHDLGGSFHWDNVGIVEYVGMTESFSTTAFSFRTNGGTDELGVNPAYTIAVNDTVRLTVHGRWK